MSGEDANEFESHVVYLLSLFHPLVNFLLLLLFNLRFSIIVAIIVAACITMTTCYKPGYYVSYGILGSITTDLV